MSGAETCRAGVWPVMLIVIGFRLGIWGWQQGSSGSAVEGAGGWGGSGVGGGDGRGGSGVKGGDGRGGSWVDGWGVGVGSVVEGQKILSFEEVVGEVVLAVVLIGFRLQVWKLLVSP